MGTVNEKGLNERGYRLRENREWHPAIDPLLFGAWRPAPSSERPSSAHRCSRGFIVSADSRDLLDEMSEAWTSVERAIWPDGPAHGTGSGAYAALKGRIIDALAASPSPVPASLVGADLDVERLAQALSCWGAPISGEGDPEFMAWAAQMIRAYLRPGAALAASEPPDMENDPDMEDDPMDRSGLFHDPD